MKNKFFDLNILSLLYKLTFLGKYCFFACRPFYSVINLNNIHQNLIHEFPYPQENSSWVTTSTSQEWEWSHSSNQAPALPTKKWGNRLRCLPSRIRGSLMDKYNRSMQDMFMVTAPAALLFAALRKLSLAPEVLVRCGRLFDCLLWESGDENFL